MPLTTPADAVPGYGGDPEHFLHVLEYLFVPAVEGAGYQAIRPIMTGADLIQAEIIRNLETADLVLCDISRHNSNVFFELGVRTSLDRPVALVRDSLTGHLPLDTGVMNTHTYDASLVPWMLQSQIRALIDHLKSSADRSLGKNPLWKYFGLTRRADPEDAKGDPTQAKLDLVLSSLEVLRNSPQFSYRPGGFRNPQTTAESLMGPITSAEPRSGLSGPTPAETLDDIVNFLAKQLTTAGVRVLGFATSPPNRVVIAVEGPVDKEDLLHLNYAASTRSVQVELVKGPGPQTRSSGSN